MCPSEDALLALVAGTLSPTDATTVRQHTGECSTCRKIVSALVQEATFTQPVDSPQPEAPAEEVPTQLGRYRILERVGAGGMGTVFAAYDPELDRRVAIKLLTDDGRKQSQRDQLQARLLREAQALGRLAHPNVVAVHDAGTLGAQVFIAMEFVEGQTLRRWLKSATRSWREIRDVFVQAAQGLSAAHTVGLVHRDFKPDNVLIGKDGRVRVADFGLAVARGAPATPPLGEGAPRGSNSAAEPLTEHGIIVGTPRYMAPEQLRGAPTDARTDQFSFGVALYGALFGGDPFEGQELSARLRRIEAGQIAPPPDRSEVPEFMRAVVRRMLSADPAQRYPSMDAAISALQRDLARRRVGAGVATAAAVILATTAAAGTYALRPDLQCRGAEERLVGLWDGARRAAVERAFLQASPDGALQFARAARFLDDYRKSWAETHRALCLATHARNEQSEAVLTEQMACLELRRREFGALVNVFGAADEKLVGRAVDAAAGLSSVGSCRDVVELLQRAPLPEDPQTRAEITAAQLALAEVNAERLAGHYEEAHRRAAELEARAEALSYRPLQAEALYLRGVLESQQGEQTAPFRSLRLAIQRADAGRSDTTRVRAAGRLAFLSAQRSQQEDAEQWLALARGALERIGRPAELSGELAQVEGMVHLGAADYPRAAEANLRAVALLRAELGDEHPKTLNAIVNAAMARSAQGEHAEALALLQPAVEAIGRVRGEDHPSLVPTLWSMGHAQLQQRDFDAAHRTVTRALTLARQRFGPEHPRVAGVLELKATLLQEQARFPEALATYREALAIHTRGGEQDNPDLAFSYDGIGQCLLQLGKPAEAVAPLERALSLSPADPTQRSRTAFALARALWAKNPDAARPRALAREALSQLEAAGAREEAGRVRLWLEGLR